jgi:DNA-binding XRE family transcriptional regulator
MEKTAGPTCERCGSSFERRTNDRLCLDCLGPLARLRRTAGLSQAELGSRVGCRRVGTVRELEREQYHPALALAERIASEFGVEVLDVFPSLQITKSEVRQQLHVTGRTVAQLCDEGELPANCDGPWHRLDYATVLRLKGELEERRKEWISFHAAEREYHLPWWLLDELQEEGKLHVEIGDGRGTRLVRRSQLDAVRQDLLDNRKRVHCPHCRRWPKLGRKAHAKCLGPLGSHRYWLDPDTREVRRRDHGKLVRARLLSRSVREVQDQYRRRFKKEPSRSLVGRWSFRKGGGRPAITDRPDYAEAVARVKAARDATYASEPELARKTGESRHFVRHALGRS